VSDDELRLSARRVARAVMTHADSPARVLVASARAGAGRSTSAHALRDGLRDLGEAARVVTLAEAPPDENEDFLIVDGPALLEPRSALLLSSAWLSSLDGALLVCLGQRTRPADLKQAQQVLADLGLPVLGVVWNDRHAPRLVDLLPRLRLPGLRRARAAEQTA
jgi:Mrp family chromosome partitioning ATPase